jgi:hypothetical protein
MEVWYGGDWRCLDPMFGDSCRDRAGDPANVCSIVEVTQQWTRFVSVVRTDPASLDRVVLFARSFPPK